MAIKNKYDEKQWDEYYAGERNIHIKPKTGIFTSYDVYLCDAILKRHLPHASRTKTPPKIVEIGSGDGKLVKKIADMFGYIPYGIEYAKEGAKQGRKIGVNTMVADAFSPAVHTKYKHYFDIVFSYGFIEHIYPTEKAIKLHFDLVKPGGIVVIQIPRFRGFNYWKAKIFRPDLLPLHNLDIMEEEILKRICQRSGVTTLFCKNYGTIKLRLPMEKKNFGYYVLKGICLLEYVLNPLLRSVFGERGFETRLFSPAVIYIGKKSDTNYLRSDKNFSIAGTS